MWWLRRWIMGVLPVHDQFPLLFVDGNIDRVLSRVAASASALRRTIVFHSGDDPLLVVVSVTFPRDLVQVSIADFLVPMLLLVVVMMVMVVVRLR